MADLECLGHCKTIGELKEALETLPEDLEWFGWDDGSIIITTAEYPKHEIGRINNTGAE